LEIELKEDLKKQLEERRLKCQDLALLNGMLFILMHQSIFNISESTHTNFLQEIELLKQEHCKAIDELKLIHIEQARFNESEHKKEIKEKNATIESLTSRLLGMWPYRAFR
jgi:hypothetical protein